MGKMQYVGQTIHKLWSKWSNYKIDSRKHGQEATCMQKHFFNHFCTSDHFGFLDDLSLTFIDKTASSNSLKREDYWKL